MKKNIPEGADSLAMAAFPKQEWCEPYDWCSALKEGTIFPCLNLAFYKAPQGSSNLSACSDTGNDEQRDRENLLSDITEISFALNDLTLYLDTHPTCENGLALFHQLMSRRLELLADYAGKFNPLTQASIITGGLDEETYGWDKGPLPWEGACI